MPKVCPACSQEVDAAAPTCAFCHVIFAKYKGPVDAGMADPSRDLQNRLKAAKAIVVDQELNPAFNALALEHVSRYLVRSDDGALLYDAVEKTNELAASFLHYFRQFLLTITQHGSDQTVFTLEKPFALFNDRAEMKDGAGRLVGVIESSLPFPRRTFTVRDHRGMTLYVITGGFWRPLTFKVFRRDQEVGEIRKALAFHVIQGFGTPDQFSVTFPPDVPVAHKALLMGALFLIDLFHFDKDPRHRKGIRI